MVRRQGKYISYGMAYRYNGCWISEEQAINIVEQLQSQGKDVVLEDLMYEVRG